MLKVTKLRCATVNQGTQVCLFWSPIFYAIVLIHTHTHYVVIVNT